MMKELQRLAEKHHTTIVTVGHIADGNLHPIFIKPDDVPDEGWPEYAKSMYDEMTDCALKLGGVGSGEHGIGTLKKALYLRSKSPAEIEVMRGIKKAFDPHYILNPDKII
jgi:glycolate oxidase